MVSSYAYEVQLGAHRSSELPPLHSAMFCKCLCMRTVGIVVVIAYICFLSQPTRIRQVHTEAIEYLYHLQPFSANLNACSLLCAGQECPEDQLAVVMPGWTAASCWHVLLATVVILYADQPPFQSYSGLEQCTACCVSMHMTVT